LGHLGDGGFWSSACRRRIRYRRRRAGRSYSGRNNARGGAAGGTQVAQLRVKQFALAVEQFALAIEVEKLLVELRPLLF
jgi:hypothetical protein